MSGCETAEFDGDATEIGVSGGCQALYSGGCSPCNQGNSQGADNQILTLLLFQQMLQNANKPGESEGTVCLLEKS
jgi:hypothetical protein